MASCTSELVQGLVEQFTAAFNAGDGVVLDRIWAAQGQGFDWYSTDPPGQRTGATAQDRSTLMTYFAKRHADQEVLRLTDFQFNGISAAYANFQYHLVRQAAELPPTPYVGKGAVFCAGGSPAIGVWSMARDPERSSTPPR